MRASLWITCVWAIHVDPCGRERLPEGGYFGVDIAHKKNLFEIFPECLGALNSLRSDDRLRRCDIRHKFFRVPPPVLVGLIAEHTFCRKEKDERRPGATLTRVGCQK